MDWTIGRESPLGSDLELLHQRHGDAMRADTPPESIHMLPAAGLAINDIDFYVMRGTDGQAVGMGALKRLGGGTAEIKSMHILTEFRGRGLARIMLDHLVAEAQRAGVRQLSLETGSQPSFAAARALYGRAGFAECEPFGSYRLDPNSTYMTRVLKAGPGA